MQPALHTLLGYSERAGDIRGVHFINFSHPEHGAIERRYLLERLSQMLVQFVLKNALFRIKWHRDERDATRVEIPLFQLLMPSRSPGPSHCLIDHNSSQPSEETGPSIEVVEVHQRPNVSRLHRVFHFWIVPEHPLQYCVETIVVTAHENRI